MIAPGSSRNDSAAQTLERATASARATAVRWRIVGLLVGFSVVSYVLRVNITITGEPIMHEFHLDTIRLGWVFSAFLFSYTAFMLPAGIWADHAGPRRALAFAALSWAGLTVLTAWLPGTVFVTTTAVLGVLIALRIVLGICEAPTYPSATRAIAHWMPESERAYANALVIAGSLLGSAVTAPLISWLMVNVGWRNALLTTCLVAPILTFAWCWYANDRPRQSNRINAAELAIIESSNRQAVTDNARAGDWKKLVRSGEAWRLFIIYGLECYLGYIFIWWFYIYLVDVRGFLFVKGGIAAALPFVVGMLSTPAAGAVSDRMVGRMGLRRGRIVVPVISLTFAGVLAFCGVRVESPWEAVALLAIGAGCCWANEGPVWAAMTDIASPIAGAAGGFLNAGSNLGGALAAVLTPLIAKDAGWTAAFGVASICSVLAAVLWLGFDPNRQVIKPEPPPESAAPLW